MTESLRENKKGIIIVLTAFLLLPIMIVTIMYFSSENFRYSTNNFLSILPGNFGNHFRAMPTREEEENIKREIAQHYITLEEDRLVDKLLIIKGEDINLYNDLLVLLNRENAVKTRAVREKLRNTEIITDPLRRVLEEMDSDKAAKIDSLTNYFSSLKAPEAVAEIERTFGNNEINSRDLALVFENLGRQQAATYLINLNDDIVNRINMELSIDSRRDLEKKMQEINARQREMRNMASVYEKKSLEEQIEDLGNVNKFRIQDLAVIYKSMSTKSGGKILSYINDGDFVTALYDNINTLAALNNEGENLTANLAETINVYSNYRLKVQELATIYERMQTSELANVIERMLRSNNTFQRHTIGNEEIVFTEEQLVVDILEHLRPNKIAELMGELNTQRAIELSQKIINQ